ncbi:O-antigen ligase domain-containing protein [Parabacteroides sp. OttesenSCG-928-G06]|nr:O-antigen ligase domain-containing protein [Parabacteroides sp. OttesenSCG-928-K15]MDL2281772.1 O-antigen ligase domain-containing protein [Parabacteroides sp. OttesenSCG-928-G06]
MIQEFVNKNFFLLFLFTLVFGVIFYDTIGFNFTDEICALCLLVLYGIHVFNSKNWGFNKLFLITISVFIFYLIYSLYIGSNTKGTIILDFIIQIKPYIGFFCVYAIAPTLTKNQKVILKQFAIIFTLYLLLIGLVSLGYDKIIDYTLGHESRFATAISILALIYLYSSDYNTKDKLSFILILCVGVISGRSKFYGFFAISTFVVLYVNKSFEMKFNLKNTCFLLIAVAGVLFVAKDKLILYFVEGGFGGDRETADLYARIALYYFSVPVLCDHIPFGSGFASYATYASSVNYSSIYTEYNMDYLYGLSRDNPKFMADTYYPALAQFGFVGVVLFFWFWLYLVKRAIKAFLAGFKKESVAALLIIFFFLIECTSDSTITHNRGLFMMMLLGLIFGDVKNGEKALQRREQ